MIDVATLTGACVVALGDEIAGMYSTDDKLKKMLEEASKSTGEKMWNMPLEKNYFTQMKSDIADMRNAGGREAGSITASLFLKEFVAKTKWAHLDIAGPNEAQKDLPICPKRSHWISSTYVHQLPRKSLRILLFRHCFCEGGSLLRRGHSVVFESF